MIKKLGILLILIIIAFVIYGFFLPTDFEIVRSKTIKAHPITVFVHIGDLSSWHKWWPWRRIDPEKKLTPGKKTSGPGASLSWTGNPAAGKLTVTSASPTGGLEYDLSFAANTRPDKGAFEIKVYKNLSILTWRIKGHFEQPVIGGYLALIADAMHGGVISWGLGNIKELVEADRGEIFFDDEDAELKKDYEENWKKDESPE